MSRGSSDSTTTSKSTASKLAARCRQACKPEKYQISDGIITFEPAKKHEEIGMRRRLKRPPRSEKRINYKANTVLPRTILSNDAASHCCEPDYCALHSSRHPLSSSQTGQKSQPRDQGRYSRKEGMGAHPAPDSTANNEGWTPWSPEDICAHHYELNRDPRCFTYRHNEGGTLLKFRNDPSATNPTAYYDQDLVLLSPYHDFWNTFVPDSANDMPLRKTQRQLSILSNDSCEKPTPPERNPKRLTMSRAAPSVTCSEIDGMTGMIPQQGFGETPGTKNHGSVRKSAVNIIRLRPHQLRPERSSSLAETYVIPSPLGSHPTAMQDTGEFPMPPVPPKSARRSSPPTNIRFNNKDRPFDVDPMDQHKTNVRRPPKGIQHWFDAYISSEDEDDSDDGRHVNYQESEPQELPAEEVLRPAHILPERGSSLGADHTEHVVNRLPLEPNSIYTHTLRSPIESDSSNSIQSSHCRGGKRTLGVSRRLDSTDLAQQSVLSMSSSNYSSDEDDDDDDVPGLPTIRDSIRDSILDDRNFEVGSAASIRVQRLSPSDARHGFRGPQYHFSRSMENLQSSHAPILLTKLQHAPISHDSSGDSEGVRKTLRRLNGCSSVNHPAKSTTHPVPDAAHVIAVTDEEMMVLEIMRKKRAKMEQASFTEFLQRRRNDQTLHEQRKLDRVRRLSEVISTETGPSDFEMERQLNDIRKAQVDAGFQIERFLGVSSPSHPLQTTPIDPIHTEDLLLPATVYSPTGATVRRSAHREERWRSEEDLIDAQRRVEQFIATQGAVPPLNSIRTMRRPSHQALTPTYAVEQAMPPVAPLRKIRTGSSGVEMHGLRRKVSVIRSSQSGMQRTSPVSAFPSNGSSANETTMSGCSADSGVPQDSSERAAQAERFRTVSAPVDRLVKYQRSLPRLSTDESLDVQRSSISDVLEGWRGLGGGGFNKSMGMTSQGV